VLWATHHYSIGVADERSGVELLHYFKKLEYGVAVLGNIGTGPGMAFQEAVGKIEIQYKNTVICPPQLQPAKTRGSAYLETCDLPLEVAIIALCSIESKIWSDRRAAMSCFFCHNPTNQQGLGRARKLGSLEEAQHNFGSLFPETWFDSHVQRK
jgi:hypothetical protein